MSGTEPIIADTWLASVLADVGLPVYSDIAPPDEDGDYIIFTDMSGPGGGGVDVRPVGSHILWHQARYAVMAVSKSDSYLGLKTAAKAIHDRLDNASAATEDGAIVWAYRDGIVRYTETTDGKVYRRLGGLYVIQVRSEAA